MKKLFFAMAAMAAMLTSCSKDDTTTAPVIERSKVTFTVNAPELSTRAGEGNGTTATQLEYVIYDLAESPKNGANQIYGTADFVYDNDNNPLTTTVEVNLVEGREYEAIFFAHAEDAPYTIDWTAQTMTINHQGLTANNEKYDAFFKYVEPFEITEQQYSVDVKMKRPFAQLNVATVDYQNDDYPAGKMIDADMTGVEVEAYKSMNLKSGNVEGAKEIIKYNVASSSTLKQNDPIKVDNVDYTWLSMNYILVNARENVGVKFYFTDKDATSTKTYTREYTQVPVERNFRTNIVGTILTSPTEFKVTIDPNFVTPNIDWDVDKVVTNTSSNFNDMGISITEFMNLITDNNADNNPAPGTYIFKIEDMVTSNYATEKLQGSVTRSSSNDPTITIHQKEGYNFIIDGSDTEFAGQFIIYGYARSTGAETLIFKNINFKHTDSDIDFISCNKTDETTRYAHNVTVENCTFSGNDAYNVVGMRFRQCYNIYVKDCTVNEGMHSLMWATGTTGISFDGVEATKNFKEGAISLGTSTNITISNSNIVTASANDIYGVRADGSVATKLVIENSQITANIPVLVRNTTANYEVELKGDNDFTYNGNKNYHIVFTQGGDNTYVAPESNWKLTGAEGLNVFPGDIVITNLEELKAFRDAVNAGTTYSGAIVKLAADINLNNEEWTPIGNSAHAFQGTFDGQNHVISNLSINTPSKSDVGLFGMTTNGEIKNLTVNNAKITGYLNVGVVAGTPYNSKFTNIKVTGHVEVYGFAYVGGVGGKNAYANWTDVTVAADETSYVKANSVEGDTAYRTYVGGVVGFNGEGGHTFKNITSNIDVEGSTIDVGGMFGIAHYGNKFENCSSSGDVEIYAAEEAEEAEEIGGIAGVWHNQNGTEVTFTNCSFTGNLSVNVEGVDLSDNTIVGNPYSSSGKGSLWVNGTYAYVGTEANAKKAIEKYTTIKLFAGEYLIDLYNIAERETLNIIGTEGTKVKFANLQVRASQFKNFTIKNCEILRMPNKSWGHLVFGSGNKADGVYTVDNCIFNVQDSQGIFINEITSGATYNITNCTFDGNFGGEGAVTIQNNDGIEHTVNVKGCTFNNIPDTSHKIYIHYAYDGWTLNTDAAEEDIYWKANN
ncbi:MAG: hypothetical protein J6K33_01400 [Alistipes sp.]|nr:hypothetical protein [Alistipes sp.]